MEGIDRNYFESFESDITSDNEINSPHDYVYFFSKISEDLRVHFTRNSNKEKYCFDIYQDIYSTPESGSYSYYKDLVAVAQKTPVQNNSQARQRFEFHELPDSSFSEFLCSSACSGHFNPTLGTGPFEELFKVLEPPEQSCCFPTSGIFPYANTSTLWPQNAEIMDTTSSENFYNSSLDDGYSDFIDIFHRLTSDVFTADSPPCTSNDLLLQ